MQNTNKSFTRVLCAILSVVMLLTAIPMTVAHAEETTPKVVSFGTYSQKSVLWTVAKENTDEYVLIANNVLVKGSAATKFATSATAYPDYTGSAIATYITNTLLPAVFPSTGAQYGKLVTFTTNYVASVSGTATDKGYSGKMCLPSAADIPASFLVKCSAIGATAGANYWTADASCANASDKKVVVISSSGTKTFVGTTVTSFGIRPTIAVAKADLIALPAITGCTYTDAAGNAITAAIRGEGFKLVIDANYNQSVPVVKSGADTLSASNDIYTVPAASTGITVEGITVNPADFTAYDTAVQAANAIDSTVYANRDIYSTDVWAPVKDLLDAPLDKTTLTALNQATVDQYVTSLNAAVANLPADFTAYCEALANITDIKTKGNAGNTYDLTGMYIFDTDYTQELSDGIAKALSYHVAAVLNKYKEATVKAYKIADQTNVDKATAAYNLVAGKVSYLSANITNWKAYKEALEGLDNKVYADTEQAKLDCAAIVAEHDYENDPVDCRSQADVDAAADALYAIYKPYFVDETKYIPTDFTALDAAIEAAKAINLDDYLTDEEIAADEFYAEYMTLEGSADETKGFFTTALNNAKTLNRDQNKYKFQSQTNVDSVTEKLVQNTEALAQFVRLTNAQKTKIKIKAFFNKIGNFFRMVGEISKTLWNLLGMLFRGEIDLYSVFEMLDVDQKTLDFLIKIGIKPKEAE
ncbi:MAG TPA: hypothetical protein DDY98_03110 [Ruminococcaceae bacterium]|nr:hypothetical protein [Oscillospiraceae bacterium]